MIALVFTLFPSLLAALTPSAEAACTAPYTGASLVKDLGSVALALRNMDDRAFASSGKALEAGLPCLDQTAPPQLYASAYRYIGAVHFLVDNDPDAARRWFRSSLELEPTYEWDAQELDLGNPMRGVWESERPNAQGDGELVAGKQLDVPSGSALLLDGKNLVEPRATTNRPHMLQSAVVGSRHADSSWLIDGNGFPEDVLKAPTPVAAVVEDPKKAKKAKPEPAPKEPVAKAEPAKAEPAKAEPKSKAEPVAKAEPAKESKAEPVAKAEPAKESKAAKVSVSTGDDGVQHMTVQRTRPKEKTPLLIIGGVGLAAAAGLYAYSWKVGQDFNEATTTEDLERLQASNHAFVIASGASLLVGAGIGYWGVVLDGNTVGFSFGGRF